MCTVSVLGRDKGYMVKYSPPAEAKPEGTLEGGGLYLTVYPELMQLMQAAYFFY